MIRVMHVLNTGKYSGAENVVMTIINLMKDRVDATYVSLDGTIKEYLEELDIDFYPIEKLACKEIKKAIKDIKPDIIHAHDYTAGIICAMTGTGVPIVNHIHNNSPWIKHFNLKSIVYALSCIRYKRILTVSDAVMKEYVFGKILDFKTEEIGNPIDLKRIRINAYEEVMKEYDIAFLGRLTPQKNPLYFIEILRNLKCVNKDINAIVIGDGELRSEIEAKISALGLNDVISLVGFQKNASFYLQKARILLMPSSWEGYGLAAVEALSLGIPVVCSNVGGLPSIVNENCGKICRTLDDYTNSINTILKKENYEMYSKNALKRAQELENIDSYICKLSTIYEEIIESKLGD